MKPTSALLLGVLLPSLAHAASLPFSFTHVTVIDATGAPALSDETVIVTGERITAVGRSGTVVIPKDAQVVEGTRTWGD